MMLSVTVFIIFIMLNNAVAQDFEPSPLEPIGTTSIPSVQTTNSPAVSTTTATISEDPEIDTSTSISLTSTTAVSPTYTTQSVPAHPYFPRCYFKKQLSQVRPQWTIKGLEFVCYMECHYCCQYRCNEFSGCYKVNNSYCIPSMS